MTIICALHDPTAAASWVASNDCVTIGDRSLPSSDANWIIRENWALGLAGDGRPFDLLAAEADRLFKKLTNPFELTQRMRAIFEAAGMGDTSNDAAPNYGQHMILANHIATWDIDGLLALSQIEAGQLWARGSGMDYALGAAHTLRDFDLSAKELIEKAVESAIANDLYCPGKVFIQKLAG